MAVDISDTNIWIDFDHAGLLNELFKLPFSLCCTDFVASELDQPKLQPLVALGLIVKCMNADEIRQLQELADQHNNPSLADMSCYLLAKVQGNPLLTGDGHLRTIATREGVEVRGALWLLDQLIEHTVISPECASIALRAMLENNARLPDQECQQRFAKWAS